MDKLNDPARDGDREHVSAFVQELAEHLPCFFIDESRIDVLDSPKEFYNHLLDGIDASRRQISLSSLYIGTGALEAELVSRIQATITSKCNINVKIILDYHRAQRVESGQNSISILAPALAASHQIKLFLFRCPQYRRHHDFLSHRWKEIIGVQHTKIYAFDDYVIISGANLSHSYFSNRQDRYYKIRDEHFAYFIHKLLCQISSAAYQYQYDEFALKAPGSSIHDAIRSLFSLRNPNYNATPFSSSSATGTWIFPMLQLGFSGINMDRIALPLALRALDSDTSRLTFASGYLNLTPDMQTLLRKLSAKISIFTASPSANGFYQASGLSKHIPRAYSVIQNEILSADLRTNPLRMFEYTRSKWTYHQKGIWIQRKGGQLPIFTVIGSSNFGYRSMQRDLESQFFIVSLDPILRQKMSREIRQTGRYMTPITKEIFRSHPGRRLSPIISLVSKLIRSWL